MGMRKGQRQYGRAFTENVLQLHYEQKMTVRETAERLGVSPKAVKDAITRENARRKKIAAGIELRRPGRPRKRAPVPEQLYIGRIKRLEMENELLKKLREELRG